MQQNHAGAAVPVATTANPTYSYNDYANWYKYYYANYYGAGAHPGYHHQPGYPAGYPAQPQTATSAFSAPQGYAVPPPPGTEDQVDHQSKAAVANPLPAVVKAAPLLTAPTSIAAQNVLKAHVGYKRPGLGSHGGPSNKKSKNKVPVPPVKCTICDITVSSEQVYITHVNGKAHKKKAALLNNAPALDPAPTAPPANAPSQSPQKKKQQKRNQKKQGKSLDPSQQPTEQVVFKCDLCSVTVNSQQQLDLHLTGAKHKKSVNRLSKSKDPEVLAKLEKAKEQVENLTHLQTSSPSNQPPTSDAANADPAAQAEEDHNLPSGYVFIPGSQSGTGKDTYLCSVCQHQSTDLITLNVHVNSEGHKTRAAEQEKPLEINQDAIDERLNSAPQEKAVSPKSNFDLKVDQTADAKTWKSNAKTFTKRVLPLSSSFVSGEVLK